jgi:hypothetical protein
MMRCDDGSVRRSNFTIASLIFNLRLAMRTNFLLLLKTKFMPWTLFGFMIYWGLDLPHLNVPDRSDSNAGCEGSVVKRSKSKTGRLTV